ncbi:MAG: hypothetical protein PHD48_01385 [Alphaproteobacteria bacterium]|nr:hypothetical protein [Alphaproteobacteria bacterium]
MVELHADRYIPKGHYGHALAKKGPVSPKTVTRTRRSGFPAWMTKVAACLAVPAVLWGAGSYEAHRTPASGEVAAISASAENLLERMHNDDATTTYSVNGQSFGVVGDKGFSEEVKAMKDAITGSKGVPLVLFKQSHDYGQVTTTAAKGSAHPALTEIRRLGSVFAFRSPN